MINNLQLHIVCVFVDSEHKFGNPVGIILDEGKEIDAKERQQIVTSLGYSESVFINNLESGNVSVHNSQNEIPFAGHALVGASWYMNTTRIEPLDALVCMGNSIKTWSEGDNVWVRASKDILPPWNYEELGNALVVETLLGSQVATYEHTFVWAWIDKEKGIVRARTFAPDWGIPEDEANGSGAMKLAMTLGKALEVHHGKGSIIYAKPFDSNFVDVGGRVSKYL
jgi:predicted PhzF superfamily epimerase YddE/YHI9